MPRLSARRGAGLAEMIVALTLSAMIAAAGATALAGTERYVRRSRAASGARRTLREAESVLASELRAASPDSVRVLGDTAVDFSGLVGVSAVCLASGNVLVLPPDAASDGPPYSTWRAEPEAGDAVVVFDPAGDGVWRVAVVESASSRVDGAACRPSSGLLSAVDSALKRPVMRVVLRSSLDPAAAPVGSPVRVMRSGRYALTRSSDGSWSLAYRRCSDGACGVAQPVAGPFAPPADSGLAFASSAGEPRIEVTLRAAPAGQSAPPESAVLRLSMRNRAAGSP